QQQQQFYRRLIGDWDFIRTIGAGSMGKVKLAKHNTTGEKCAVKIVPRAAKLYQRAHANDPPLKSQEEANQRQKEYEKELARDKRTIREGALGRLLFHPHICRLYEMVPMTNHYYMLFEYVEGGQLLDYIVSHGSLNEKYARKFARGIASALDYCHKNNVVHRDLKIENIMINKDGEIKIIDFGLSNLYTPHHLLKTYCGSLYFAAPELLCAKPYTGPEVDVWSFGVVLYVLVCGKVPFDDPVVSALHEKIKKGNVEYPSFISRECVSLLSRMLVVNPAKRATLEEVIQHPWMNKGFEIPVPSYAPKRLPLTLPLDPQIVQTISSLDLGSVSAITEELTTIISSPEYRLSSDNWFINSGNGQVPRNTVSDPVYAYHPLVSVYYLVDEMRKRKRAKEEAMKSHMRQQYADASHINQAGSPVTQLRSPLQKPKKPPLLPFPEKAHTSITSNTAERSSSSSGHREELARQFQQQQSPKISVNNQETLDPNSGKSTGFNSLIGKMSGRKHKNQSPSPSGESTPVKEDQVVGSISPQSSAQPLGHLSPVLGLPQQQRPRNEGSDLFVRRGVSMKITAKEKFDPRGDMRGEGLPHRDSAVKLESEGYRPHGRSISTAGKPPGYVPLEYLPPLPKINTVQMQSGTTLEADSSTEVKQSHLQVNKQFHPTARAKSLGLHARKDSTYYRSGKNRPALPDNMAAQNSDDGVNAHPEEHGLGLFDDVTLDEKSQSHIPQLSEAQIIEQFNNAKRNTMLSIEYPKTFFLKGFFSVQTTSTKPLPVIRYNILRALSKVGVLFQEVKGGFLCVHASMAPSKEITSDKNITPTASTIIDEYRLDLNNEERRLYGDAFDLSSGSLPKLKGDAEGLRTPDNERGSMQIPQIVTPQQPSQHLSRQGSLHGNEPSLTDSSINHVKGHKSSNSTNGGHRRRFSIGQTFLQNYRKKDGSQSLMPPNTPAAAKINKILNANGDIDGEIDEETLAQMKKLYFDDYSMESVNDEMNGGGSDMLVSSRIEQRARHQRSNSVFSEDDDHKKVVRKTPLKFEINIVKVPLVGLYGVQFKKTLGNTWSYKTLASRILEELNL
ncbi:Pkinase-domain-containing protein, partial [Metschnikowia bicuspidata var. bicuspidata NRRL YB-4993]